MKKFTTAMFPLHIRIYLWLGRVRHFLWWKFRATEAEKCIYDGLLYGTAIMKNGKRIDPMKIYK